MTSHVTDYLSCHIADNFAAFLGDEAASSFDVEVEARRRYPSLILQFFAILLQIALLKTSQILVAGFVKELSV